MLDDKYLTGELDSLRTRDGYRNGGRLNGSRKETVCDGKEYEVEQEKEPAFVQAEYYQGSYSAMNGTTEAQQAQDTVSTAATSQSGSFPRTEPIEEEKPLSDESIDQLEAVTQEAEPEIEPRSLATVSETASRIDGSRGEAKENAEPHQLTTS